MVVDSAIAVDVPGKTTGGVLKLVDADNNNKEYRIRFNSWTGSTFTLANVDISSADAGTASSVIVDTSSFTNAKRGDLVVNKTRSNAVSYITRVDNDSTAYIAPVITNQTLTDAIELNCVPISVNTADTVYVPLLDKYATASSESVSIIYSAPINYRVVCRNSRNTVSIVPFSQDDATSGANKSNAVVRNTDTIKT